VLARSGSNRHAATINKYLRQRRTAPASRPDAAPLHGLLRIIQVRLPLNPQKYRTSKCAGICTSWDRESSERGYAAALVRQAFERSFPSHLSLAAAHGRQSLLRGL
jgi:hypothetical protein